MSSIFYRCIKSLGLLFKGSIATNFSFHSSADFTRKVSNRTQKYPAIVIRSTKIVEDKSYVAMNPIITKNLNSNTYIETRIPKIYDLYFKCILFSEGNIEGLEAVSNIVILFEENKDINVEDFDPVAVEEDEEEVVMTYTTYNINLISLEEDNEDNSSDLTRYELIFFIEGVEFVTDEVVSGKLAITEMLRIINM